jgi:hypothetical protein
MRIPLASKSDPAKREIVSDEKLVNLYAEQAPSGAKADFALYRTEGHRPFGAGSDELCRGMFVFGIELLVVAGDQLLSFDSVGNFTVKGTIPGSADVQFSRNDAATPQVAIVIPDTGAVYKYESGSVSLISDNDLGDIIDTEHVDGFQLMIEADGTVQYSTINDLDEYDALDFVTAEGDPDGLLAIKRNGDDIFLFGVKTTEVFRHVDDADNPFQRVKGAVLPVGIINKYAKYDVGGILCWVDNHGIVRKRGASYNPDPISNSGVQKDIAALADKETIRVFGFIEDGHGFLIVRSPFWSWTYDFKERRWHNRASSQRTTWKVKHYARFANKHIVAGDQEGGLFYLDPDYGFENGERIVWEATLPPIDKFPNGASIFAIDLNVECGTAMDSSEDASDQEPMITLYMSIDGGKTFEPMGTRSLGRRGEYRKQVRWTRLGKYMREGCVLKFSGSSGAVSALMSCHGVEQPKAA